MGDNTQVRNHNYIIIIEVIYKASGTTLVLPLLVKIKNAHTALLDKKCSHRSFSSHEAPP